MQTPWNQLNQTLQSWIRQELRALIQVLTDESPAGRRWSAASLVHQLFLSSVVKYPELWSLRRDYYSHASLAMVELWRELGSRDSHLIIAFACQPEETSDLIDAIEAFCLQNPWKADLVRLKGLMGMGEVEIAEILDIPERSVHRQIAGLPTPQSHASAGLFS